jgi:hypothetical protein
MARLCHPAKHQASQSLSTVLFVVVRQCGVVGRRHVAAIVEQVLVIGDSVCNWRR